MKYCPYCGATLLGGAVSFCSDCGKKIPKAPQTEADEPNTPLKAETELAGKSSRSRKKKVSKSEDTNAGEKPQPEVWQQDEGYDGYYDDVPTLDNGHERERLDLEVIKKICLIIGGALVIIGLSVALMLLL